MSTLILLLLFINGFFSFPAFAIKTMRLELIHRHTADQSMSSKTQAERVTHMIHIDNHRVHMISQRLGRKRRRDYEIKTTRSGSPAAMPINSGAYTGTGQYFVQFRVGTPSQKFLLVADTGSDLTWMNCIYNCRNCSKRIQRRGVFHARRSSSFRTISCSSQMCQTLPFSLVQCSTPTSPCQYDYRYVDGSTTNGIFARETVTVGLADGRKMELPNVVIGCSSALTGTSFVSSDGVLGLGYSNTSFVTNAKEKFGGKFSYCLVDHLSPQNVSSYLTFGRNIHTNDYVGSVNMQYTELVLDVINGFYPVNVAGISIGGVMLNIPNEVWNVRGEGGMIVDSGTSLTFLAEPAYNVVMTALKTPIMKFAKEVVDMKPFEYCFTTEGFEESTVPKLVFHFTDSAQFEPPTKSYVIDVAEGVRCLGFMSSGWPDISILGNIMQQNFLWEFDTVNKRLGFAPSACDAD